MLQYRYRKNQRFGLSGGLILQQSRTYDTVRYLALTPSTFTAWREAFIPNDNRNRGRAMRKGKPKHTFCWYSAFSERYSVR